MGVCGIFFNGVRFGDFFGDGSDGCVVGVGGGDGFVFFFWNVGFL